MEQNHCGHLGFPINTTLACFDPDHPVDTQPVSAQSNQRFGKRCRKLIFKMAAVVAILSISSFSYFVSTKCPNAHHLVSVKLDYRRDVQNMNSLHFSHKCTGPIQIHGEANLTLL